MFCRPYPRTLATEGRTHAGRTTNRLPFALFFFASVQWIKWEQWLRPELPGTRKRSGNLCCGSSDGWRNGPSAGWAGTATRAGLASLGLMLQLTLAERLSENSRVSGRAAAAGFAFVQNRRLAAHSSGHAGESARADRAEDRHGNRDHQRADRRRPAGGFESGGVPRRPARGSDAPETTVSGAAHAEPRHCRAIETAQALYDGCFE